MDPNYNPLSPQQPQPDGLPIPPLPPIPPVPAAPEGEAQTSSSPLPPIPTFPPEIETKPLEPMAVPPVNSPTELPPPPPTSAAGGPPIEVVSGDQKRKTGAVAMGLFVLMLVIGAPVLAYRLGLFRGDIRQRASGTCLCIPLSAQCGAPLPFEHGACSDPLGLPRGTSGRNCCSEPLGGVQSGSSSAPTCGWDNTAVLVRKKTTTPGAWSLGPIQITAGETFQMAAIHNYDGGTLPDPNSTQFATDVIIRLKRVINGTEVLVHDFGSGGTVREWATAVGNGAGTMFVDADTEPGTGNACNGRANVNILEAPPGSSSSVSPYRGEITGATCSNISGWACQTGASSAGTVHLYANAPYGGSSASMIGGLVASASAPNSNAAASVASICGSGARFFNFSVPTNVNLSQNKMVFANYINGAGNPVVASREAVCSAPPSGNYTGGIIRAVDHTINGYACMVGANSAGYVRIYAADNSSATPVLMAEGAAGAGGAGSSANASVLSVCGASNRFFYFTANTSSAGVGGKVVTAKYFTDAGATSGTEVASAMGLYSCSYTATQVKVRTGSAASWVTSASVVAGQNFQIGVFHTNSAGSVIGPATDATVNLTRGTSSVATYNTDGSNAACVNGICTHGTNAANANQTINLSALTNNREQVPACLASGTTVTLTASGGSSSGGGGSSLPACFSTTPRFYVYAAGSNVAPSAENSFEVQLADVRRWIRVNDAYYRLAVVLDTASNNVYVSLDGGATWVSTSLSSWYSGSTNKYFLVNTEQLQSGGNLRLRL